MEIALETREGMTRKGSLIEWLKETCGVATHKATEIYVETAGMTNILIAIAQITKGL